VDKLLTIEDLIGDRRAQPPTRGLLPVSRAWVFRHMQTGGFPRPVKLGRRAVWKAADVEGWICQLKPTPLGTPASRLMHVREAA
jgi:hypothetical protein